MKLITPTTSIWFCRILRTAESKFTPRNSGFLGLNHCSRKDVIGSVVAIGDVVRVQSVVGHKIRRTVVIEYVE
ncbi:hypothetical protein Tco_0082116 [Tanacetum coccineum]